MDNDYIKEKSKEENLLNILKVKCINSALLIFY